MNKIIAIVGMCGSGKSIASDYYEKKGFEKIYFGGVTLDKLNDVKYNNFTVDKIKNDATILKNVKEAVHCNLWVLIQSNYMNMVDVNSEYVNTMTWWRASYIAVEVTSATLAGLCLAVTVLTSILDKKKGRK